MLQVSTVSPDLGISLSQEHIGVERRRIKTSIPLCQRKAMLTVQKIKSQVM